MTRALRLSALVVLLASPTMPGAIQAAAAAQTVGTRQPRKGVMRL